MNRVFETFPCQVIFDGLEYTAEKLSKNGKDLLIVRGPEKMWQPIYRCYPVDFTPIK